MKCASLLTLSAFYHPQSLRARLVFWNILILILALIALSTIVYWLVYYSLLASLDKRLSIQGEKVQAATRIRLSTGHPVDTQLFKQLVDDLQGDEFTTDLPYIKLLDVQTGETLQRSANITQEKLLPQRQDIIDEFHATAQGEPVAPKTYQDTNGQQVRVLTLPIFDRQKRVIVVAQIGRSLASVNDVLFILAGVLFFGSMGVAFLAYLVSFVVTSRELRALHTLSKTMRHLSAQRLGHHLVTQQNTNTDVRHLIEAFNAMSERLQASFTLQRAFVADVSHELRTPLTAIRGQVDVLLLHPDLQEEVVSDVQQIRNELARLSRLVTNLLTIARAEVGVLPQLAQDNTQLIELDTLLIEIARQGRFTNPQIAIELGDIQQGQVMGDVDLLKQLFFNIIDNALTYTPAGGRIFIEIKHSQPLPNMLQETYPEHMQWLTVSIRDTGPGIAANDLPHIFERHYRASLTSSRSKLGAGLGLSIAHLIVQAHRGEITVESERGKGACFAVWLPAVM